MTQVDDNASILTETSRTTIILNINDGDSDPENQKSCGFHLSRSKWDPYPWVGCVEPGSIADIAGLRAGDCLLEIDGTDLVGLRVKDIASLVRKNRDSSVRLQVWRSFRQEEEQEDGAALTGPLPEIAKKLAKAVSGAVRALECPVCLESATSPVSQCVHGHILCVSCRAKTPRCPVCRVRLGQGRCLVADELQRNIREAFEEAREGTSSAGVSLREKLFGRVNGKSAQSDVPTCNIGARIPPTKVRSSLARLLLGGFDKAASAENLSVPTLVEDSTSVERRPAAYRRLGELSQNDRAKSASTGELSKGNETPDPAVHRLGTNRVYTSASGFLSVPQTPTWGASTESIGNASFVCPLSGSSSCKETVTANFVLEHLSRSHEVPQIHFHGRTATIPIPPPFGRNASYIIHYRGELFFFKYEDDAAWIAASGTESLGEWSLIGQNRDGTQVKLQRQLARLDDVNAPLSCHLAPLPKPLGINSLVVELMDSRLDEGLHV